MSKITFAGEGRINEADRLIYEIQEDQIIVKSCRGHYEE